MLIVLLASLSPLGAAANAAGSFVSSGPVSFEGAHDLTLTALSAVLDRGAEDTSLVLLASRLTVSVYEIQYAQVPLPGSPLVQTHPLENRTWESEAGEIVMERRQTGFIGIYPEQGARLSIRAADEIMLHNRAAGSVSTASAGTSDQREFQTYMKYVPDRHIFTEVDGPLHYQGPGAVKALGPHVVIRSAHNETAIQTGEFSLSPTQIMRRWVYVSFVDGEATMQSASQDVEVAARAGEVTWDGTAHLSRAQGHLQTEGRLFSAQGEDIRVSGSFKADLLLRGNRLVLANLGGDLRGTTLSGAPLARPPLIDEKAVYAFPLAALAVSVVVCGFLVYRHRTLPRSPQPAPAPQAPTTLREQVDAAEEEGRWEDVVRLVGDARKLSVISPLLLLQEATARREMNDVEAALGSYEEAAALLPGWNGTADYWAALLCAEHERWEEAMAFLQRALARDPGLCAEVESTPEFAPLKQNPEFMALIIEALERMYDENPPDADGTRWYR